MCPLRITHRLRRSCQTDRPQGVALVAVLAVLTTLAVLAGVFATYMHLEQRISSVSREQMQADLLAQSALEHVFSLLRHDANTTPAWDDYSQPWSRTFQPNTPESATAPDGWVYVRCANGITYGRYRVSIEDEAGKININAATALDESMQNEGVGTFEIMLYGEGNRGLPIPLTVARDILRYRYGRDLRPGQANVDDNHNAMLFQFDRIDNNADGRVDEPGEGIDEPQEYNPHNPAWDDRVFSSVRDLSYATPRGEYITPRALRELSRVATVASRSQDVYWDERTGSWQPQVNMNVADNRQLLRVLRRANSERPFEPSSRNLRIMAANLIDYRDENHALSTVGNEYGVEAVCFNEIMANDGSYSLEGEGTNPGYLDRYTFVHRFGIWYNEQSGSYRYGYPIEYKSPRRGSVTVRIDGRNQTYPFSADVRLGRHMIRQFPHFSYNDFQRILTDLGGWVPDMWKNVWLHLRYGDRAQHELHLPIHSNTRDFTLTVGLSSIAEYSNLVEAVDAPICSARILSAWRQNASTWCMFPETSDFWAYPTQTDPSFRRPADHYYYVQIGEQSFGGTFHASGYPFGGQRISWKGYNVNMDVNGDPRRYSETRMVELRAEDLRGTSMTMPHGLDRIDMLRWNYKDGEPVRARNGFIHVLLSSTRDTGYANGLGRTSDSAAAASKVSSDVIYIMRPDIIELINISDTPISMRNWRVVINTGSYADQVAVIDSATQYNRARGGFYDNPNPSIPAGGYFYLTNNRRIFDMEYGGSKTGVWGDSPDEQYGCFELLDDLWGVRYKITRVSGNRLYVEGANWRPGQMVGEMMEIHSPNVYPDRNGPTGIRKSVWRSGPNWLDAQNYISWPFDGVSAGDDVVILGMPRQGGFLSMTMKNEYNQIVARTVEYGSVEEGELNHSTEKFDPTHYTWIKTTPPTFGGTEARARNRTQPHSPLNRPYVKNSYYASIGEIQQVRTAQDWENIGADSRGALATRVLRSVDHYFTVSGVRLDAEEPGAHISGWQKAFGTIRSVTPTVLTSADVAWEPGIWEGQRLRMMSGESQGRIFAVGGNARQSLTVEGYSIPGDAHLRAQPGDVFSVGPGYMTPMFYTRRSGDRGEWEWKNKGILPGTYGLYIFGLNDSIDTTEFLEENYNAEFDVEVWNFQTREYESMPVAAPDGAPSAADDVYGMTRSGRRFQCDKSDGFYCGQVYPQHISSEGGIRVRLTPHNVGGVRNSGFAWFDYAYLAPAPTIGKINLNTAPPRVLSALQGITPRLAHDIAQGINNEGQRVLKPYRYPSDILSVRGMTPDIYRRIGNLITTRSDQFRVVIDAETFHDISGDGIFREDLGDTKGAIIRREVVIDRSKFIDNGTQGNAFTYTYY